MTRQFQQATKRFEKEKQGKYPLIPGFLGFNVNGINTVEVPTRPGYVFVRLRGVINEVVHAFNDEVSPVYGLPVLVTRDDTDNTRYRIISRDTGVYVNWGSSTSYLPRHGNSHSFSKEAGSGGDVVWVYGQQMMPLNVMPSGSNAAGGVKIFDGVYYQNNQWHYAGGTGTVSLLPAKPTDNTARMLLIYLDGSGNPGIATGTTFFSASLTGTADVLPYVPTLSSSAYIPLAGVRLVSGTSTISWNNLYDLRPWIVGDGVITSSAPDNASYVTLGNDATLSAERVLTAGAGISITDNGANNTVVIAFTGTVGGGGGGSGDLLIYDNGSFVVTGTAIDFGDNITVAVTGTTVFVSSVDTVGGGGTPIIIYDDGVFKATGTSIIFNDNLTVIASGSSVWVNAAASGGGGGSSAIPIYDSSVFKVTGTSLNFTDNIYVNASGTVAHIGVNLNTIVVKKADSSDVSIEYPTTNAGFTSAINNATYVDEIYVPAGYYTYNGACLDLSIGASLIGEGSHNTYVYINNPSQPWAVKTAAVGSSPPNRIEGIFFDIDSSYDATGTVTLSGGLLSHNTNIKDVALDVYHNGVGYAEVDFFIAASLHNNPDWLGTYGNAPRTSVNGLYVSLVGEGAVPNYVGIDAEDVYGTINDFSVSVQAERCTDVFGLVLDHNDTNVFDQRVTNGSISSKRLYNLQASSGDAYGIKIETGADVEFYKHIIENVSVFALNEIEYENEQYNTFGIYNSYNRAFINNCVVRAYQEAVLGFTPGLGSMSAYCIYSDANLLIKGSTLIPRSNNTTLLSYINGGDSTYERSYYDCTFEQIDATAYGGVLFTDSKAYYYNCSVKGTSNTRYELHTGLFGSGTTGPSFPIYDDDTYVVDGTAIHFNESLSVISSGTSVWVNWPGDNGGNTLRIYDNDTFVVTGTSIHFNDNLDVIASGSNTWVNAVGRMSYPSGTSLWINSDTDISSTMENYDSVFIDAGSQDVELLIESLSVTDGYRLWIHRTDYYTWFPEFVAGQVLIDSQYAGKIDNRYKSINIGKSGNLSLVYTSNYWKIENIDEQEIIGDTLFLTSGTSGNISLSSVEPSSSGYFEWNGSSSLDTWEKVLDINSSTTSGDIIYPGYFDVRVVLTGEGGSGSLAQTIKFKIIDTSNNLVIGETNTFDMSSTINNHFTLLRAYIPKTYRLSGNLKLELWASTYIYTSPKYFRLYYGVAYKKSRVSYPPEIEGFNIDVPSSITVYDDGIYKSSGTVIDFGSNINVISSGTSVFVSAVGGIAGPPGNNTLLIYDDSIFKVTGTSINFGTNLNVAVTGSTAFVNESDSSSSIIAIYSIASGTSQTITNGAAVAIVDYDEQWTDTNSAVTTGANWKFTAPSTGFYSVSATFMFNSATGWAYGERVLMQLNKNGNIYATLDRQDMSNSGATSTFYFLHGTISVPLSAGEYIDVRVAQNSGGNITNNTTANYQSTISIHKI